MAQRPSSGTADHEVDNLAMAMSGRQRRAPRSDLTLFFDRRLRNRLSPQRLVK